MPYPNDRRKQSIDPDESLSTEFLAILVACGGEVRAGDKPGVSEAKVDRRRRRRAGDNAGTPNPSVWDSASGC